MFGRFSLLAVPCVGASSSRELSVAVLFIQKSGKKLCEYVGHKPSAVDGRRQPRTHRAQNTRTSVQGLTHASVPVSAGDPDAPTF